MSSADDWIPKGRIPWRRFLARTFDNAVFGVPLWYFAGTVAYAISPAVGDSLTAFTGTWMGRLLDGTILLTALMPLQAAMLAIFGTTPGKWLCGLRVRDASGRRPSLWRSLKREFGVWSLGYAAGLPLVSLFTLWNACASVQENGEASWDEEARTESKPLAGWVRVGILIAIAIVTAMALWNLWIRLAARLAV